MSLGELPGGETKLEEWQVNSCARMAREDTRTVEDKKRTATSHRRFRELP